MAYIIRSDDGRLTVCIASPIATAEKVVELQLSGLNVEVRDFNGATYKVAGLLQKAASLAENIDIAFLGPEGTTRTLQKGQPGWSPLEETSAPQSRAQGRTRRGDSNLTPA